MRLGAAWPVARTFRNPWSVISSRYGWGPEAKVATLWCGVRLEVRTGTRDSNIVCEVFGNRMYDRYLDRLAHGGTVIDIGANIGAFSILAALRAPDVRVYSYEPQPDNVRQLRANVALNHLESRVRVCPFAVGGRAEARHLMLSGASGGHSFYGAPGSRSIVVNVIPLETVFSDNDIGSCEFLKIDCEGAEYEILYGAPRRLFRRIRTITMEFHTGAGVGSPAEVKAFLEAQGYRVEYTGTTIGMLWAER